jgi:outer membrane receptor for ferrienterochelin and colicin
MSAQYGSNASGGVINMITKKSQLNKFNIQSQSQYESIGIFNNTLSIGTQLDKLYISLSGTRHLRRFETIDS